MSTKDRETAQSPLSDQVGGTHYKSLKMQPFEFLRANNVPHAEGECIYKLLRWREKGGVEDLRKVRHHLDLMIGHEEKLKTGESEVRINQKCERV